MRVTCGLAVTLALCVGLLATRARAQESPPPSDASLSETERTAHARDLFEQGVDAARRSAWAEAADRFARALDLRETAQIRYNLAESLYHLDRIVEAGEHVAALRSGGDAPPAVRRSAEHLAARIDEAVSRLTIRVDGHRPRLRVMLDGRELPDAVLGVETRVDPGRHVVRLLDGSGAELARSEVSVERGAIGEVAIVAPPEAAPEPSVGPQPSPLAPAATADESGGAGPWWLWAVLAVVVAGAAVGAVLLFGGSEDPTRGDFMPGVIEVR